MAADHYFSLYRGWILRVFPRYLRLLICPNHDLSLLTLHVPVIEPGMNLLCDGACGICCRIKGDGMSHSTSHRIQSLVQIYLHGGQIKQAGEGMHFATLCDWGVNDIIACGNLLQVCVDTVLHIL